MNDKDIIQQAYANTLERLFGVFFESSIVADTPKKKKQAEDAFTAGIQFARDVRDRALTLVV